jgi:hypothetical protein
LFVLFYVSLHLENNRLADSPKILTPGIDHTVGLGQEEM